MRCLAVLLALAGAASACPVAGTFQASTCGAVVVQPAVAVVATVPAVQIVTPAVTTVAVTPVVAQAVVATPVVQTVVATPVVVQKTVIRQEIVQQRAVRRANVYGGGGGGFFGQIRSNAAQGAATGGLLGAAERVVGVGDGSGQFLQGALIGRFLPGGGGFRFKR